jgi:formate hydrogenlyase subunit 6/NADH:ubiquinone oxidoreductase subunit I/flavodoxin
MEGEYMNTIVYFFSGTGNSLALARKIQENTSATMISIPSILHDDVIEGHGEAIGIVTPVYYGGLPNIVKVFLQKLKNISRSYIFLVINYGGGTGSSVATAKKIVKNNGGQISAVYSVHMPQNSFSKSSEQPRELYAKAEKVLSHIQENIIHKRTGTFSTNRFADSLQGVLYSILKPMYQKHLRTLSSLDADATLEETIYKADKTFSVNENCHGCGTCAQICPVENIRMIDGTPHWLHHCENCLACYNWCPQKAIHGALVEDNYYYRHPDMTIKDQKHQKRAV